MRFLILLIFLFIAYLCEGQHVVDPNLGKNKDEVTRYFTSLISDANCSLCEIKNDVDSSGNVILELELPVSQKGVMASIVAAFFYYSEKQKKDICVETIVYSQKEDLQFYLDKVRSKCHRNSEGVWEFDTGVIENQKRVVEKYIFSSNSEDHGFKLDCYLALVKID
jgi:hypothetical protein